MLVRFGDLGFGLGTGFSALDDLRRDVDRAFEGYDPRVLPRVGFHDEGDALVVEAEVPGFDREEIHVSLEEDTLTIRGQRRAPEPADGAPQRKRLRSVDRFTRSFALPVRVDAEKVTATLRNGILELRLPKAAESKAREIAVRAA